MKVIPRSLLNLSNNLAGLVEGKLWLQVLLAMFLGVGFGIVIGPTAGIVPCCCFSILFYFFKALMLLH